MEEKIRFDLVKDGTARFILMSTDLTLLAPDIIRVYSWWLGVAKLGTVGSNN